MVFRNLSCAKAVASANMRESTFLQFVAKSLEFNPSLRMPRGHRSGNLCLILDLKTKIFKNNKTLSVRF